MSGLQPIEEEEDIYMQGFLFIEIIRVLSHGQFPVQEELAAET